MRSKLTSLVVALAILGSAAGLGSCIVLDAFGFTMSPLLPTVRGPEDATLLDTWHGTLASVEIGSARCANCIEFPSRAERELCLRSDFVRAAAAAESNVLVYVAEDHGLMVATLDDPEHGTPLVRGIAHVGDARVGVGASGAWAAVAWSFRPEQAVAPVTRLDLIDVQARRIVWSRPITRVEPVGVLEAMKCVVFADAGAVRTRDFDGESERELACCHLIAVDRENEIALVRVGHWYDCVSVRTGEVTVHSAKFSGLAGRVIGLWDCEIALYEARPTEGEEQARYRLGLRAPASFSTIKLANVRTGAFATMVSAPMGPGSFSFR